MAIHRINGLGWFLCGMVIAPACYVVTSPGAAERAQLRSVEAKMIEARREIRALETEFNTRANMVQLQQWNGEVLALAAPSPDQYLASETDLAMLDAAPVVQTASLVVPSGPPAPTRADDEAPASSRALAGNARQAEGEVRVQTVAMLDRGALLSPATLGDLQRAAADEQSALR